jgi:drug/metabolite transporter (DMT)-like permease
MFLPFAIREGARFDFALLGAREWLAIGYYAVVGTVAAAVLWSRGLAEVPASTAGAFSGVLPVSTVALSYVVLGESFAWSHVLGAVCVIAGILLLARQRSARYNSVPRSELEEEP